MSAAGAFRRRLRLLGVVARVWRLRLTSRKVGAAVMHHRIDEVGGDWQTDLSPAVGQTVFEAQLDHLRRHYAVVGAHELQRSVRDRRRGRRVPIAITFDDDLGSHLQSAAPALTRRRMAATFFLNGHALAGPRAYWWERLQAARDRGQPWASLLPQDVMASAAAAAEADGTETVWAYHVSEAVQRMTPAARQAWAESLRALAGEDPADSGLRRAQVRALSAAGFAIGFHGAGHEPLSHLAPDDLARELDQGRAELEAAAGRRLEGLAYPHGKTGPAVAAAAAARGFEVGFTVEAAAVTPGTDPLLLGRVDGLAPSLVAFASALIATLEGAPH